MPKEKRFACYVGCQPEGLPFRYLSFTQSSLEGDTYIDVIEDLYNVIERLVEGIDFQTQGLSLTITVRQDP